MDYTGYRHVHYNNRKKSYNLWTWDKKTGERIVITKPFKPYLYVETTDKRSADATSIYNTLLRKLEFDNAFERNKYAKECGIKRLFYNLPPEQQILIEEFGKENNKSEFSQYPLKIYTLDIESYSPNEFPDPEYAKDTINLITIHDSLTDTYHTWGLEKEFIPHNPNIYYYQCLTEIELLKSFLNFWKKNPPDIVTGWNIGGYDIPYLINRINNILDENTANTLSPINDIYKRENISMPFGKIGSRWYIRGISIIDYMDAYITFSRDKQESYKLDHIGKVELNKGKLEYNATSLSTLSETDWNQFVKYNIQDTEIVVELERKLKFLMLVRMLAHLGMTNFESALGTISIVTGALALQAMSKDMIIPTFTKTDVVPYDGGFVKPPQKGLHEAVVSFDANSLYPNTIITLNISPETKIGKIHKVKDGNVSFELSNGKQYTLTTEQFSEFARQQEIAISKANVLFSQKRKGFCPELVDILYADRVKDQKELKSLKLKRNRLLAELKELEESTSS